MGWDKRIIKNIILFKLGTLWLQNEAEALEVFWVDTLNCFPAQKHHLQTCSPCECRASVNGALSVWDLITSPVSRFSGNIMTHQAVKKRVFSFQNDKSGVWKKWHLLLGKWALTRRQRTWNTNEAVSRPHIWAHTVTINTIESCFFKGAVRHLWPLLTSISQHHPWTWSVMIQPWRLLGSTFSQDPKWVSTINTTITKAQQAVTLLNHRASINL